MLLSSVRKEMKGWEGEWEIKVGIEKRRNDGWNKKGRKER